MYYRLSVRKGILPTTRLGLKGIRSFLRKPTNIINSWDSGYTIYEFPHDRKLLILLHEHNNKIVVGTIIRIGTKAEHNQYLVQEWQRDVKNHTVEAIVDYIGRSSEGSKRTIKLEFTP